MVPLDTDGTDAAASLTSLGPDSRSERRNVLLTNHHVAEPWWGDAELKEILDVGAAVRRVLHGVLPGTPQGIVAKLDRISHHADLATLKLQTPAPPHTALLELDDRSEASVSGDPVVLIGYPTGIEGILARAGSNVTRKVAESAKMWLRFFRGWRPTPDSPTTTQGHIGDVLTDTIVYDARQPPAFRRTALQSRWHRSIGVNSPF